MTLATIWKVFTRRNRIPLLEMVDWGKILLNLVVILDKLTFIFKVEFIALCWV